MHVVRSRGTPDTHKASQHESVSVAVPSVSTHRSASPPPRPAANFVVRFCHFVFSTCRHRRRFSLLHWYRLLKRRNLLCCGCVALFLVLLSTLLFLAFAAISLTWEWPLTQVLVREYLTFLEPDEFAVRVPGVVQPREPQRLWGLSIAPPVPLVDPALKASTDAGAQVAYTAQLQARLEQMYGDVLLLYTFANGTERTHAYRRLSLGYCGAHMQSIELQLAIHGTVLDGKGTSEFCTTPMQRAKTNAEVVAMVDNRAELSVSGRDRETDELRHSLRSVEQHIQWHRGRVVMVSPGHHPTWVDGAKNFLAGTCGGAAVQALRTRGTHLRLTTVHQDAIMATHARLTVNTHPIEHQLWRVKNITAVHVYMNDDYFVNRDVAITDLFNEYGGTIVRTESSLVSAAYVANDTLPSWAEGVSNTNYFTIGELDLKHEDDVPAEALRVWQQESDALLRMDVAAVRKGQQPIPPFLGPDHRYAIWVALELGDVDAPANLTLAEQETPESVLAAYASKTFGHIRPHFFATHAPFVYCTNMLRHFASRYQMEYSRTMFFHRSRSSTDLYVPFMYNAFVMTRPWQASPRFPGYLMLKNRLEGEVAARMQALLQAVNQTEATASEALLRQTKAQAEDEITRNITLDPIRLDNCDGCAPATMLVGISQNGCLFGRFVDNVGENHLFIRQIAKENPMFFNVNTGLTTAKAADQLRSFLREKYPTPIYLEKLTIPEPTLSDADAVMTSLFTSFMRLPLLAILSYEEGICPLVRSLSLAFAGHHKGRVQVALQRHGLGEVDATLEEVRAEVRYRFMSALPSVGCTFTSRVNVTGTKRGESVTELARRFFRLRSDDGVVADAGVTLPSTCGGAVEGLRARGFVVDARTPNVPIRSTEDVYEALAMPGQTLALEDFRAVRVGPEERDVVLVLSREDAEAKAVHWITGASENDLLMTFPLPLEAYEDMSAPIKWVEWKP